MLRFFSFTYSEFDATTFQNLHVENTEQMSRKKSQTIYLKSVPDASHRQKFHAKSSSFFISTS